MAHSYYTRIKAKSSQTLGEHSAQIMTTPSTNEPPVSINWLLFNPAEKDTVPESIDIPASLYRKRSQDSRNLFCRTLRHPYERDIIFWKPKELLLVQTAEGKEWASSIRDIYDSFQRVSLIKSFAKVLDISNQDAVHLVVTIENYHPGTVVTEHREPSYPMYNRLQGIKAGIDQSPSVAAKSGNYIKAQASENRAIRDGRSPFYPGQKSQMQVVTMAPPIQIFHPIFDKFLRYINDPPERLTREFLQATMILMQRLSRIDSAENGRNRDVNTALTKILGPYIAEQKNNDQSLADGSYFFTVNETRIPILIVEMKRDIGEGGSDPCTQAAYFMQGTWFGPNMSDIQDRCCCPGFMIGNPGPWMSILGSVTTDRFIVQRLTDLRWGALSSTSEDERAYRFARELNALRLCIGELEEYYTAIGAATDLKGPPYDPHPRYFPYPQSYTNKNNDVVCFEYLQPLEKDEPTCVTFLAKTAEKQIVVKFVSRYGVDAHRFLAAQGHAPRLYYHGPLPDTKAIPTTLRYPGLALGPMQMVVMDYITPCETTPSDAKEQLRAILDKFHKEGYVFGDLREQNVIFDEEQKAHLIDFDWAGRFDNTDPPSGPPPQNDTTNVDSSADRPRKKLKTTSEIEDNSDISSDSYVYYPLNISTELTWATGVAALEPIRPSHDLEMLERFGTHPQGGRYASQ